MADKASEKVVNRILNPKLDRGFFRFITAILLIVFLVAQLPWVERLLWGKILNFPDLRHHSSLSTSGENNLASANLEVINLGFGTAREVLVHVHCGSGSIVDYHIDSQELYQIKNADLGNSVLDIWLDRLAPGASIRIELVATGLTTDSIQVSATSNQGTSIPTDLPSFSGQTDDYVTKTIGLFSQVGQIIGRSQTAHEVKTWISSKTIPNQIYGIVRSPEFQTVVLAALILIVLIIAFLPDGWTIFLVPLITAAIVWLFFDFQIPTWWAITAAIIALMLCGIVIHVFVIDLRRLSGCEILLGLIFVIGCFGIWWYWHTTMSARWVLGIVTGLATFTILMLAQQ
jgi:hypothetical protein